VKVIGILGGIGSGKTYVARQFERMGARRIDADRLGHLELESESVRRRVRERWGKELLTPEGKIDRKKLAAIVFSPTPEGRRRRRALEEMTHPGIVANIRAELESYRRAGVPAVVLDAALLLEAGWSEFCDLLVYVDTPEAIRHERTGRERGWSRKEHVAREETQESLEKKRDIADYTIDNSDASAPVFEQVQRCWGRMIAPEVSP
jgi:dephospho-CoA kinase